MPRDFEALNTKSLHCKIWQRDFTLESEETSYLKVCLLHRSAFISSPFTSWFQGHTIHIMCVWPELLELPVNNDDFFLLNFKTQFPTHPGFSEFHSKVVNLDMFFFCFWLFTSASLCCSDFLRNILLIQHCLQLIADLNNDPRQCQSCS